MLSDPAFWLALCEIIWINLLLSGDNALVIAMACRSLPPRMQRWGIVLGTLPAVVLRIAFSVVVAWLTAIPFLRIVGGVLLVWIAYCLVKPQREERYRGYSEAATIWAAARTIIIADAVMSLDNVVAIAAAAHGNMTLLVIGLTISMPMVVCGAGLLTRVLERFPILVIGGGALLGYIAGDLIVTDPVVGGYLEGPREALALILPIGVAMLVAFAGYMMRQPTTVPKPHAVRARPRDAA